MAQQPLAPIPDGPEFDKSLADQAEEMLLSISVKDKPSSVSKLYEWTVAHPGPEATATAAMAVKLSTKVQFSPAERRLSMLYAVHELFRRASKDLERDFDYAAWKDAVRAVVPWAWRKQNEADQAKIHKSVLKTWVNAGWLSRDFVESLIPGKAAPKKNTSSSASKALSPSPVAGKDALRRRRQQSIGGGRSGGGDVRGSVGSATKRQRTSPASLASAGNTNGSGGGSGNGTVAESAANNVARDARGSRGGSGAEAGHDSSRTRQDGPFRAVDLAGAGYSPLRDGVSAPADAHLPAPTAEQLASALADMAAALTKVGGGDSGGGGTGIGDGGEGGGANTVTPSPEGNRAEGASPDAGAVAGDKAQERQRKVLSLKLDGCGLIRRIGKAMKFPVRVMLTAFHLFHHYQWCGSVTSFKFPPAKLPAVCLACILAATKAEDCNAKLETLIQQVQLLEPILPPLEGIFPLGKRPTPKEVVDFEYKILLSRGFDLEMVHPTEHLSTLLALTGAPMQVGELAYEVLCSRVYTDSTLCLEEDPLACLCAAVQFLILSPLLDGVSLGDVSNSALDDWPMIYGASNADVLSFTERLVQSARDLADIAPGQTFMISRTLDADTHQHAGHHHQHHPQGGAIHRTGSGGKGFSTGGGAKNPHAASKTPERARRRGTTGSGGGGSGGTHRQNPQSSSRKKVNTPSSSSTPARPSSSSATSAAAATKAASSGTSRDSVRRSAPATTGTKQQKNTPKGVAETKAAPSASRRPPASAEETVPRTAEKAMKGEAAVETAMDMDMDMDMDVESSPEPEAVVAKDTNMQSLQQGLRDELARQRQAAEARVPGVEAASSAIAPQGAHADAADPTGGESARGGGSGGGKGLAMVQGAHIAEERNMLPAAAAAATVTTTQPQLPPPAVPPPLPHATMQQPHPGVSIAEPPPPQVLLHAPNPPTPHSVPRPEALGQAVMGQPLSHPHPPGHHQPHLPGQQGSPVPPPAFAVLPRSEPLPVHQLQQPGDPGSLGGGVHQRGSVSPPVPGVIAEMPQAQVQAQQHPLDNRQPPVQHPPPHQQIHAHPDHVQQQQQQQQLPLQQGHQHQGQTQHQQQPQHVPPHVQMQIQQQQQQQLQQHHQHQEQQMPQQQQQIQQEQHLVEEQQVQQRQVHQQQHQLHGQDQQLLSQQHIQHAPVGILSSHQEQGTFEADLEADGGGSGDDLGSGGDRFKDADNQQHLQQADAEYGARGSATGERSSDGSSGPAGMGVAFPVHDKMGAPYEQQLPEPAYDDAGEGIGHEHVGGQAGGRDEGYAPFLPSPRLRNQEQHFQQQQQQEQQQQHHQQQQQPPPLEEAVDVILPEGLVEERRHNGGHPINHDHHGIADGSQDYAADGVGGYADDVGRPYAPPVEADSNEADAGADGAWQQGQGDDDHGWGGQQADGLGDSMGNGGEQSQQAVDHGNAAYFEEDLHPQHAHGSFVSGNQGDGAWDGTDGGGEAWFR